MSSKKSKSLNFKRHFTRSHSDPFHGIEWVERTSQIQYAKGKASEKIVIRAPKNWSQIAVDIMAQKYSCKSELHPELPEKDIEKIINRVVDCWLHWGEKLSYFDGAEEAKVFGDELKYMLVHQMASPNSPQWFNTGLFHRYGLKGNANGHFYYDEAQNKVIELESSYERPQAHACFIQSVEDSLLGSDGIADLWKKETRLFKYGSGTGTNFSKIREKGGPLSEGGTSSGLMSWLEVSDKVAGAIKSGGTTRRAAKMVCLDLDHPEIEDFISWKVREEEKVAAMIVGHREMKSNIERIKESSPVVYAKYHGQKLIIDELSPYWEGEAYQSVSGQNSNNSIRIPDSFFDSLDSSADWDLRNRVDSKVSRSIKAADLWNLICESAWSCADPGLQFDTTINEWHTCPQDGRIEASNPCSEYMFLDDTACNLASLNLVKFWREGEFDLQAFEYSCRLWITVLDISVSMASYPSSLIAKRSFQYRTLGLGIANLGGLLMRMGIPYDSEEACAMGSALASLLGSSSYHQSGLLAQRLGAFERFSANKEDMLKVLYNHKQAALGKAFKGISQKAVVIKESKQAAAPLSRSLELWKDLIQIAEKSGMRNAQVTAIAPTGTIGLLMDCDTTGIEPEYSWIKVKSLAGGGQFQIINQSIEIALENLGYTSEERAEITKTFLEGGLLSDCPLKDEHYPVFQTATGAAHLQSEFDFNISAVGHLNMMAAVQPFISGAISKTLNLPSICTVDDVKSYYRQAHRLGLKAIAIYRNGSKLSQPLAAKNSENSLPSLLKWTCPHCAQQSMVPSGTCYQCENCGESTSC